MTKIKKLAYCVFIVLFILSPLQPLKPQQTIAHAETSIVTALYRVQILLKGEYQRQYLEDQGILILEQENLSVLLLVDNSQLEQLARLRFQPRQVDELGQLVEQNTGETKWLEQSLQPLLQKGARVTQLQTNSALGESSVSQSLAEARTELRAALAMLSPTQQAGIASLSSVDDDGDGLTNTEEQWWCTDPLNPNSDGDAQGFTDGQEVQALLDFTQPRNVRWGYGPPFGPPNAWPNFNDRNGTHVNVCNDGDWDTIPDYAEVYMVGTRVPEESTDRDKFDDGQELFGITFCPGAPTNCGYGSYPAIEYWNFIQASMPNWVLPPGDNPLVAAFPVPEVYVTPGSWHVERVTTITTSQGEMTQTSNTYETSVMRGQGSSIANTVTWNNWEEVSQAIETPLTIATSVRPQWAAPVIFQIARTFGLRAALGVAGRQIGGFLVKQGLSGVLKQIGIGVATELIADKLKGAFSGDDKKDNIEIKNTIQNVNVNNVSSSAEANASVTLNQNFDFQGVVNSLDGVQYAISQQGELLARGLYDISYQLSRPRFTETRTSGRSWGGAQTTTHEEYEEHTITEGQAFTTGQNWSTAWAVDSSHAADLTFEFTVKNTGTEYARELTGIVINIYIGDDTSPAISYPAWQKFPNGKLENLFPVGPNTPPGQLSTRTFATDRIPLSLEQMKRIDLGERLTVKVESYSFGADELFYTNAVAGGVTVFIEDGVEDGDETVDSYVIPTWGVESVQDVLTRYFPAGYDADGNLNAIWTPEFDGINPPIWREHYLSDIAWWNVYLTQADAGDTPLKDLPARAGSGILFRFNRDSDRDGYNDRAEFRYYCALPKDQAHPDHVYCADAHLRPEIHPQPEVAAGYVAERSGNVVTVKLAVQNTGTFDAYGIDAVMYSPDDTTTIGNNTVGGNGRVRPNHHVAVGSLIQPPDLANWGASTAKPYAGGQFSGAADRTFTFTAETAGVVGQGDTSVRWNDGAGNSGLISLGGSYHAPLPVDVAQGLQVGFNTGTIMPGARFTVQALTPRDTFTYTINSEPFTPPVIVVSYSDPQGSHRFITPVELTSLDAGIPADQMLEGLQVEIVTPEAFNAAGANTTHLVVNNPHPATIQGGHLYLNFVSDGRLVLEKAYTLDIPAGPTVFPANWSVAEFSTDYHPDGDNLLIAFWTDSEGNIIDSAARPLSSFQQDPQPESQIATEDLLWDFGTAQQGTLLQKQVTLASSGFQDLLTYLGNAISITVDGPASLPIPPADTAVYTLTVNTQYLPLGDFLETLPIRTSDPDHPTRSITIRGTITAMPPDTPGGATLRPLDWAVTIPGSHSQGEWVEFTHTLGPDPQTLHPVKVYSQDYSTLWGVGKYATPFGEGTASYDMFGDGRDGVMPSSGNLDNNNGVGVGVVNSGSAGSYTINVTDAYAGWRINPGDVVLIHQTQGANAGCWELNKAVSDFGSGTASYQLEKPLRCNYASGGNNHAQIQRVPQYTDCPVSGTVTPLSGWNGSWGGVFAVQCSGIVNLTGQINVSGANGANGKQDPVLGGGGIGFGGGRADIANNDCLGRGVPGEGILPIPNGNGGEGSDWTNCNGGDGAGGGNGTPGQNGYYGRELGRGGLAVGNETLTMMNLGGGGAGSGGEKGTHNVGGGGAGGGIVVIIGKIINLTGSINANGGNGGGYDRGAGGGAGGSIYLRGQTISLGNNLVTATGGSGGPGAGGGDGGVGRIRIEYCESFSGFTNPPASTQKLACYIAEQVESTPYTTTRLNLPESFSNGRTYQVQYGRRLVFGGAGEQTTTLRVPAGMASNVTLDSLISQVGSGSLTFRLDLGNDGSWDWEYTGNITDAAALNSPSLTHAFNAYWAAHGAPRSGTLDVPVKVSLSKSGQVMLTNLQMTALSSQLRQVRLAASDYSQLTLDVQVGQSGSGSFTVAADVGDDGSVDWTFSGNSNFPAHLRTANLATAFNAYLSGRSGELDVPIRFFVEPDLALTIQQYHPILSAKADATLSAADISFSSTNPVEGDMVGVTVQLQNNGSVDSGRIMAAFYATAPGWGEWYVGSAFVPNIPAGGSALAEFPWNTEGFHGDVPLRVVIDPYQRLSESNENNNSAVKNLAIRTRPDLEITYIGFADSEPMTGETVNITLQLRNNGQATAGNQTVVLYQGNPDSGGSVIGSSNRASIPGGATDTVTFIWTPVTPGPYRLFARVDIENLVRESDEENNEAWQDIYIGLPSPILLDSGTSGDLTYNAVRGFGVIDEGQADILSSCGSLPYQTLRRDPGGKLVYQFDHLLPGHFYHLDVILYECDQAGRVQTIRVDEELISEPVDLSDGRVHSLSLRLDPAFYRNDHSVRVTIEAPGIDGAVVGAINFYDVDYRYADAGGSNDPQYPSTSERKYGWLDGVANTAWGILPYQSVRVDQSDNTLRYRFDQMEAAKSYQLLLTIWQPSAAARIQNIQIDGVDTDLSVNSGDYQVHRLTVDVPKSAYSSDGSITVGIVRTNSTSGAFVNEIALEEKTITAESLPPVADFDAAPLSGYAPLAVHFTDKSSGTITSRVWDFGDGSTDTTINPVHTYQTPGLYSVKLTVSGPGGEDTKTVNNLINVTAIPSTTTVVKIAPPSAIGSVGVPVTVTVAISNVTSLGSFQFTLNYDVAEIVVQNIRIAEFPTSTGRSFTPIGPSINNTLGQASFGAYSLGETPPGVSGSGTLAYIRILPIASGTTNLQLSNVQISNVSGSQLTIQTQDGIMQILACIGDFDGDGDVDILDVQRVAYRWNSRVGDPLYNVLYDVDKDGDIDIVDIQSVAYYWGRQCSFPTAEPTLLTEALANASIGIEPQDETVTAGQVITRSVVITNAEDLGAFEFTLGYNPQLLEVQAVTLGAFPASSGRAFTALGPIIDENNGKVSFGAYSVGSSPNGVNGNGVLAILTLRALESGSVTLSFDAAQVSNRMGSAQPIALMSPATLTILPPKNIYLPLIMR